MQFAPQLRIERQCDANRPPKFARLLFRLGIEGLFSVALGWGDMARKAAKDLRVPVFITYTSGEEVSAQSRLPAATATTDKKFFVPPSRSVRGSSTLRSDGNSSGTEANWPRYWSFCSASNDLEKRFGVAHLFAHQAAGSRRKISTRRFRARPASVLLSATGSRSPRPSVRTFTAGTPRDSR